MRQNSAFYSGLTWASLMASIMAHQAGQSATTCPEVSTLSDKNSDIAPSLASQTDSSEKRIA